MMPGTGLFTGSPTIHWEPSHATHTFGFDVPANGNGRRVFITFDGADSALFLWIKGPSMNNVCTLARAPGGQMQGAATQAMSLRVVEELATQQMPARRPAGFVARSLQTKEYARRSRRAIGPGAQQQSVNVIR